jgi:hypothetical protein
MSIWSKLFGSSPGDSTGSDSLVEMLTSDEESIFQAAMSEVVNIADSGDGHGIELIRNAIKIRAGKENVSFYEPGIVLAKAGRYENARELIVGLARRKALLDDVYHSGDLISAFMFTADPYGEDARGLLSEILSKGGISESHAFQLLFNELRCSSRRKKGM